MESSITIIDGVTITPLKKIHHPKGDIYHALKCAENSFVDFGEAYFTTINHGDLKGWKQHSKMVMNLVVPMGNVRFYVYNPKTLEHANISIGLNNYARLTVRSGVWTAFEGIGNNTNLVLNIASIPHDPNEATNVDVNAFPLSTREFLL